MKLIPKVTLKEMVVNTTLRQPLIIAMMMMMAQQLSGINCVSPTFYPQSPEVDFTKIFGRKIFKNPNFLLG